MPNTFELDLVARYRRIIEKETEKIGHYEYFETLFEFELPPQAEDIFDFIFDGKLIKRAKEDIWPNWRAPNYPKGKTRSDYSFKNVLKRLIIRIRNQYGNNESFFDADDFLGYVREVFKKGDYYDRDFGHNLFDFLLSLIKACIYLALDEIIDMTEVDPKSATPEDFIDAIKVDGGYYRGIGDYDWKLWSALYRHAIQNENDDRGIYVDRDELFDYFDAETGPAIIGMPGTSLSLMDRYKLCFDEKHTKKAAGMVDYDLVAWMQHVVDNTHFIDFTRGYDIAIWFALQKEDPSLAGKDAGIYVLDPSENPRICKRRSPVNSKLEKMELIYISTKINPLRAYPINGLMSSGAKTVSFLTLLRVISIVIPSFEIIDIPTNDLMKVQKGAFVFFHQALFIDGEPFTLLSKTRLRLRKYRIRDADKKALLAHVRTNNAFLNDGYLLDPYSFFRENPSSPPRYRGLRMILRASMRYRRRKMWRGGGRKSSIISVSTLKIIYKASRAGVSLCYSMYKKSIWIK